MNSKISLTEFYIDFPPAQKENRIFSENKNLPLFPPAQKENRLFSENKNLPLFPPAQKRKQKILIKRNPPPFSSRPKRKEKILIKRNPPQLYSPKSCNWKNQKRKKGEIEKVQIRGMFFIEKDSSIKTQELFSG